MSSIPSASGTYADGTGHSCQSHLIYAANAGVWWYFTITSASDTAGNPGTHTIKSYFSSSKDLTNSTWTASTSSPNLDGDSGSVTAAFRNGRSLGVLYINNAGGANKDIIHISASMFCGTQPDAGNGINGHIRAVLTGTTITWGTWGGYIASSFNYLDPVLIAGNAIGRTTDGYIQAGSSIYHNELDASIVTSNDPDISDSWTAGGAGTGTLANTLATITALSNESGMAVGYGISNSNVGITPTTAKINSIDSGTQVTTSATATASSTGAPVRWNNMTPGANRTNLVLDNNMTHECCTYAFAPLASNQMLAIYDSGGQAPPNFDDLNSIKSTQTQANGFWPLTNLGTTAVKVFGTTSIQELADWCAIPVSTTNIFVAQRNGTTTIRFVKYTDVGNGSWVATTNQPPTNTGKSFKAAGGIVGVNNGTDLWLFVIDGTDNAIKYCKYTVGSGTWDSGWTTLTTVSSTAQYLACYPSIAGLQAGLCWQVTNGSNFDTFFTSLVFPEIVGPKPRGFHPGKGPGVKGNARFYRSQAGFGANGPTVYTQTFSAGLSFSGSQSKFVGYPQASSLSFSGSTPKSTSRKTTAALSFAGTAPKQTNKLSTAALSFIGAQSKSTANHQIASLSFVGAQPRFIRKGLTASLSFVGALSRFITRTLTAGLSFSGSLTRTIAKAFSGALSFSGAILTGHLFIKLLTAALSFVGSQTKLTTRPLTANLSFSGAFSKFTTRALTASLSFVGSLSRFTTRALTAALNFVGSLVTGHLFIKALTAALSFVGSQSKAIARPLSASVSFAGAFSRFTTRPLTAALSFIGAQAKASTRALTASLSFVGNLPKTTLRALGASLSFSGAFTKKTFKAVTAALSFVGTWITNHGGNLYFQSFTASVSFIGSAAKTTKRGLFASLGTIGSGIGGAAPKLILVGQRLAVKIGGIIYEFLD